MAVSGCLQLAMMLGYVRCKGMARETLLRVDSWAELLDGWLPFVKLALGESDDGLSLHARSLARSACGVGRVAVRRRDRSDGAICDFARPQRAS